MWENSASSLSQDATYSKYLGQFLSLRRMVWTIRILFIFDQKIFHFEKSSCFSLAATGYLALPFSIIKTLIVIENLPLLSSHWVLRSWLIYYHTWFIFERISVKFTSSTPANLFPRNFLSHTKAVIIADLHSRGLWGPFLTYSTTIITLRGFLVSCPSVAEQYVIGYRSLPPKVLAER